MAMTTRGRVAFLPWLRLRERARFGDIEFIPFLDANNQISIELKEIGPILKGILSSYKTLGEEALPNCTILLRHGHWHFPLAEGTRVESAVAALFLAAIAANDYLCQVGEYANWSMFELIVQEFDRDGSGPITIVAKRRDGTMRTGGYNHGEVVFSQPAQCAVNQRVRSETEVLAGLERAAATGSESFSLIEAALGFLTHAFPDRSDVDPIRELISTATAFEQLFDARGEKLRLATRFGELFEPFAQHITAEALADRPNIYLSDDHAEAQRAWPIHKKWVHELYQVRNKAAHRRDAGSLQWGWSIFEHLLMGAWVFPLVVKLKLAQEGHYMLTTGDRARCLSVDRLLVETDWNGTILEDEHAGQSTWHQVVSETRNQVMWDEAMQKALRQFVDDEPA